MEGGSVGVGGKWVGVRGLKEVGGERLMMTLGNSHLVVGVGVGSDSEEEGEEGSSSVEGVVVVASSSMRDELEEMGGSSKASGSSFDPSH